MEKVKSLLDGSGSISLAPTPPFGVPSTTSADLTGFGRSLTPPPLGGPASPAPSVTNPTMVLDELVAEVGGVRGAMLASVDGFGIARSRSMSDEASHPAMLAAAVGLAHQLAAMGGGNTLRQLVVEHDNGLLVVWPAGQHRVVAVLAASSVDQRRLRAFVQSHVRVLAGTSS